ncbi:uncharacterized protein ColSpa_00293 [Colletotrichum spaethianum]|uniref:Uncharacterized protein n=1 Tax=Colletotrichum spaethianum TaxID=700344 RepID=A0AA37L1H1_9PEZI|nr:uncharacterized protein ColSpa_00293 [Colletotrichum spaethianum]GKT40112.1 hypothetical protein ColSpa_00293 [Colletotrichum spaethianum]
MTDFIARIEQDALRNDNREPAWGSIHNDMVYQQWTDSFLTPVNQSVMESAQTIGTPGFDRFLEESYLTYPGDVSASGPKAQPFLETEFHAQPRNYHYASRQQLIEQKEEYEREEMNAFWRPNYSYY